MSNKEAIIDIFRHKKTDRIVFSPRLYYWYIGNRMLSKKHVLNKSIPTYFLGKSQLEIYQILQASPRYTPETLYFELIETNINPDADIFIKRKKGLKYGETIISFKTPIGNLTQIESVGGGLGAHPTEYPIKSVEDLRIIKYILDNTTRTFSNKNFVKAENILGEMGVVSTYLGHSPYQKLVTELIGFSKTILFMRRYPSQIENFIKFLENWDNQMYNEVINSPIKIINFGENIDGNLSPPPYFEKYLIPYYEQRTKQFHEVGKFCHIHIDGSLKDLLPYLENLPFDDLEALTAKPQGDVSLKEIKEAIGEKILLDGIPSILFLPEYSLDYVTSYTKQVLDLFYPNLILGVSDELSPNGDITKVESIAKMIREYEF